MKLYQPVTSWGRKTNKKSQHLGKNQNPNLDTKNNGAEKIRFLKTENLKIRTMYLEFLKG